jgi:hypothetical protein
MTTFRITFHIRDTDYAVVPLDPDPAVASKAYRLHKLVPGGASYDVYLDKHGPHCECLGFLRWNKPCKHIRTLQAAGMI